MALTATVPFATPATAATPSPTNCTITGTPGNDRLIGTSGADVICGLGGNDTLIGNGGRDTLVGGRGNDRLNGSSGADMIMGNDGRDILIGGTQADRLIGGNGVDQITAGTAGDICAPDAADPVDGTCTVDTTGPEISDVQIPSVIDAGDTFTVSWRVTDASGIDALGVGADGGIAPNTGAALGGDPGFIYWCGVRLEVTRVSGSATDGVYQASCKVPDQAANGNYQVILSAADVFGNSLDGYARYADFEVRNGSEDRSGPGVGELSELASSYAPGDEVTFTMRATDETGVAGIGVFVVGPNNRFVDDQSQGWITESTTTLTSGDATDGIYTVKIKIAETAIAGDYGFLIGAGDVLSNRTWTSQPGFRVIVMP